MSLFQRKLGVSSGCMSVLVVAGGLIRDSSSLEQQEFQFNMNIMLHDHTCEHVSLFAVTSSLHRHTVAPHLPLTLDYHILVKRDYVLLRRSLKS